MPLLADYASLVELKSFMRITDTADDTELGFALTAASRAIDQVANRHFGQDDTVATRYYTVPAGVARSTSDEFGGRATVAVDDIATVTGLILLTASSDDGAFDQTLVINTDFRLWPWNAAGEGRPWERIVLGPSGSWPAGVRNVSLTAKFGWPAIPTPIKNATLVQAGTILKGGRDSPLGIAGSPDFGNELRLSTKLHPIAAELVRPYVRMWAVA